MFRQKQLHKTILRFIIILALLFIHGCRSSITPSPLPSPYVISVRVTPALLSLRGQFNECILEQESTGLVLSEIFAKEIDITQTGLALRWGMEIDPGGSAVIVGQEELVIVVSPQNPVQEIVLQDIQAFYLGERRVWPESSIKGEVQAWSYPNGDDTQIIFDTAILNGVSPVKNAVSVAPDPQAMIEMISSNSTAMGFIPRRWLTDEVKEIQIQGVNPEDVRKPILAISPTEPQGFEKDWLLCLQEKLVE